MSLSLCVRKVGGEKKRIIIRRRRENEKKKLIIIIKENGSWAQLRTRRRKDRPLRPTYSPPFPLPYSSSSSSSYIRKRERKKCIKLPTTMNVPRSGLLQGLINNNKSSSTKREHELAHRRSIQVHTVEPTDGQTSGEKTRTRTITGKKKELFQRSGQREKTGTRALNKSKMISGSSSGVEWIESWW